jgi:hypothetical protein
MRGPTLLRKRIKDYLMVAVPEQIQIARTQWALTEYQLPLPQKYDAVDPYAADRWPIVGAYVVSDRDNVHRDFNPAMEAEYATRYTCRIFVSVLTPKDSTGEFVRGAEAYEETVRLRDDMKTIVMQALLQSPSLGGFDIEVMEDTVTTDYDEPMRINEKLPNVYAAAATMTVEVRMTESLYLPPAGEVETVQAQVVLVPRSDPL